MKKILLVLVALALASPVHAKATCQTKQVVMFMTDWCPYCRRADAFFRFHEVDFKAINIEKAVDPVDMETRKLFPKGQGVPYILVEGQIVYGYEPLELQRLLCITN